MGAFKSCVVVLLMLVGLGSVLLVGCARQAGEPWPPVDANRYGCALSLPRISGRGDILVEATQEDKKPQVLLWQPASDRWVELSPPDYGGGWFDWLSPDAILLNDCERLRLIRLSQANGGVDLGPTAHRQDGLYLRDLSVSPKGDQVAFVCGKQGATLPLNICVMDLTDGAIRVLTSYDSRLLCVDPFGGLCWHPRLPHLIFVEREVETETHTIDGQVVVEVSLVESRIIAIDTETCETSPVYTSSEWMLCSPTYGHACDTLAFIRTKNLVSGDLMVLPGESDEPSVVCEGIRTAGIAWDHTDEALVFVDDEWRLVRIPVR